MTRLDRIDISWPHRKNAGHYELPARCCNCGWWGLLRLAKGQPKPPSWNGAECPRCGCKEVYAK